MAMIALLFLLAVATASRYDEELGVEVVDVDGISEFRIASK